MSRFFSLVLCVGLLLSTGCSSLAPLLASLTPASPVPTQPRPTATPRPPATETPVPQSVTPSLRIWLPKEFDPAADNDPARLLKQRLDEFKTQHPGLQIDVRLKKVDDETGFLNALSLTRAAAPEALPDLILLSRPEMEVAVRKGLLHPIDGLSTSLESPDWYGYAKELGRIQNTAYGLPLAGDALVLVYYPELGTMLSWEDVLASKGTIVFPAGNQQGLVGLSLYASAGGEILDTRGLPMLNADVLKRVLFLIQEGETKNVFSPSLANVTTEAQTLQIYRTGNSGTNKGIIWILDYRLSADGMVTPLPGLEGTAYSYATGWLWALAGDKPENQQLAAELAEYLVGGEFMKAWTRAAGYLPTRPSAVETSDRKTAAILESAHPIPATDVLNILGPLMQEAITRVLKGEQPEDVTTSVVEKLK